MLPPWLDAKLKKAPLFNSSCSPEAYTLFIDADDGFFLKRAAAGTLAREAVMTQFFYGIGLGAEMLVYHPGASETSAGKAEDIMGAKTRDAASSPKDSAEIYAGAFDWLLTRKIPGDDCTAQRYRDEPERLCDTLAETLAKLHATSPEGCPIPDHTKRYLDRAYGNFEQSAFDVSFYATDYLGAASATPHPNAEQSERAKSGAKETPPSCASTSVAPACRFSIRHNSHAGTMPDAASLWNFICAHAHELESNTLLHGDYCLPNIILDDWRLSGFVDLDSSGVGDRHVDLFWTLWTLRFNLKTDAYRCRFIDAYGRDRVDEGRLRLVAAIECFG